MEKKKIITPRAPAALGPYSQAVAYQNLLFVSGQLPIDPATGKLIEGEIGLLTRQVIQNLEAILIAAGSDLSKVVRTDVFLKDLKKDFAAMNGEYARHFGTGVPPARQTIQVSGLPLDSPIEISCIAYT
jgi:2-iminobutanoate/2-iminopropanoate deaminase